MPTRRSSHRLLIAAIAVVLATACGDTSRTSRTTQPGDTQPADTATETIPYSEPTSEPTSEPQPTAGTTPGDVAGFGDPAADQGDFADLVTRPLAGVIRIDDRGCWYLTSEFDEELVVFPAGTRWNDPPDSLTLPDGRVIRDGDAVDATGDFVARSEVPGGASGRLGTYGTFCGRPDRIVVTTSVAPTYDSSDEQLQELAGELSRALFTDHHGCGFGFQSSDPDQHWALRIGLTAAEPPPPGRITLPDDRFEVTVLHGDRLFADHCDDVREVFEPLPVVVATWPVSAGTFVYPGEPATDCSAGSVSTELIGARVDTPAGSVDLEPVTLWNPTFGCFAG